MDFQDRPEEAAFRAETRQWLEANEPRRKTTDFHLRSESECETLSLEGPAATLWSDGGAVWQHAWVGAPSIRIVGGTDEVQRNVLGERVLGLPAEPGRTRPDLSRRCPPAGELTSGWLPEATPIVRAAPPLRSSALRHTTEEAGAVIADREHPLGREVTLLFRAAMVVFVWTVGIGILNGSDVVDFDRKVVLSHVHAGTLGWITISVFAAALWLFGAEAGHGEVRAGRFIARTALVVLPAFGLTFAFTYEEPRAVIGGLALAAIVTMFSWVLTRFRHVEHTTVHLAVLSAIATSVAGGVIGVLLATEIATGRNVLTDGGSDAHPATMVVGFLIPIGMALAEWGLRPSGRLEPAGRAGTIQVALPFAGGILLMVGLLLDVEALPPVATLIELAGVVVFFRRLWRPIRGARARGRGPGRYAAMSAAAIVANIVFLNYLVAANGGDIDLVPDHQLLALDHMMFVGVLTNAIFALLLVRFGSTRWPRVDDAAFVGMNVALIAFLVSLVAESTWMMRVATPVLGLSILAGLADRAITTRSPGRPLPLAPA